ncbi:bifunctional indole-3-glycerol-phosphate synthase TrpC/phosphoribosylanthranilate isomerase TrpF [Vibrio tritonius]|uniref:bifunctional indole-3-glycerol-phosphate synthase TrpC/phosphoribosylanthranilate isomerase TrpF n=1 Tax=Vibrio tritonius TaxID=1435069 RepID=UPI000839931E|nr:bifunctional indole-3-glycerol-phosphate synthase TrpC/phosphoribosylanthranilate isomerase TrpF [Vibrio tritonius]
MSEQLSEHISVKNAQMAEVLAKIVNDKYLWVEQRKAEQPLESFQPLLTRSDRSFYDALGTPETAFILECKKASPSKGLIRDVFDLDYIASVYNRYASAISVLTDEKYFQGNLEFLPQVRRQVTQPVLCKDFIVDAYQIYLARHYQADAILLMLSVLNDEQYREFSAIAHELGLGVLTEASNEEELNRALNLNAKVVGINNRNLRDLTTDLNRTKALAPLIPEGTIIISESGVYTHQQVLDLAQYANGFLIGSSLMSEENLEFAVRKVLLGENKVCGLTRPEDAVAAYQAGAIYGGLIFVPQSKRYIELSQAQSVIEAASLNFVGVFQNATLQTVISTARELGLYAVQLHGEEDQTYVSELRQHLPMNVQIWKAYGVSDSTPALLAQDVDRHLLDSKIGQQSGGTGKAFDWSVIAAPERIILAGGLNPDNVAQAHQLGCIGLDFNSGVELEPGIKDRNKITQVFEALRRF